MELTNEEIVTKLLTANEILRLKKGMSFITTPLYDLGAYLKNYKYRNLLLYIKRCTNFYMLISIFVNLRHPIFHI